MEAGLSAPLAKLAVLARAIAPGSRLVRAWPLAGGLSAEMTAFEIQTRNEPVRRMVLRRPSAHTLARRPQAARDEFQLLRAARAAGLPVPPAYVLDQDGVYGLGPCLVIDYIDGQVEFSPADRTSFIQQLAVQLAGIHRLEVEGSAWSFLPPSRLAGESEAGPFPDAALETQPVRAALAAAGPPARRNRPALLHGDYWPGNVLWRNGQIAAVIDWEDAARGDPLEDLAIARLDVLCLFGPEAMLAFTEHYMSAVSVDAAALPYWDLCAALRLARLVGADLAGWAAFFAPFGRPDITEHTLRASFAYFVGEALSQLQQGGGR